MRQGFNNLSVEIYTNCLYGHEPLDVELLVDATGSAEADAFFPVRVLAQGSLCPGALWALTGVMIQLGRRIFYVVEHEGFCSEGSKTRQITSWDCGPYGFLT